MTAALLKRVDFWSSYVGNVVLVHPICVYVAFVSVACLCFTCVWALCSYNRNSNEGRWNIAAPCGHGDANDYQIFDANVLRKFLHSEAKIIALLH